MALVSIIQRSRYDTCLSQTDIDDRASDILKLQLSNFNFPFEPLPQPRPLSKTRIFKNALCMQRAAIYDKRLKRRARNQHLKLFLTSDGQDNRKTHHFEVIVLSLNY